MAKKTYPGNVKRGSLLWKIGLWATVWWAVSCLYALLLVWQSVDYAEEYGWMGGLGQAYSNSVTLHLLLGFIMIVWAIGAVVWLRELERHNISYKVAFKDLFLTIRK